MISSNIELFNTSLMERHTHGWDDSQMMDTMISVLRRVWNFCYVMFLHFSKVPWVPLQQQHKLKQNAWQCETIRNRIVFNDFWSNIWFVDDHNLKIQMLKTTHKFCLAVSIYGLCDEVQKFLIFDQNLSRYCVCYTYLYMTI